MNHQNSVGNNSTYIGIDISKPELEIHDAVEILTSTKGGGDNSALSLLAAMPELGKPSNRQASSLAGLAPFNKGTALSVMCAA